jgi:hypothetical protein
VLDQNPTVRRRYFYLCSHPKKLHPGEPPLSVTCRQIRHEVLSVLYGGSRVIISDVSTILSCHDHVFDYLRKIDIEFEGYTAYHENLESVSGTIEVESSAFDVLTVGSKVMDEVLSNILASFVAVGWRGWLGGRREKRIWNRIAHCVCSAITS